MVTDLQGLLLPGAVLMLYQHGAGRDFGPQEIYSYIQYVLGTCTRHIHCAVIPEMNSELQGAQICMDKAEKRSLGLWSWRVDMPRGRAASVRQASVLEKVVSE